MSIAELHPNEYAAWVAAGGIESNFYRHLLAIGSLPATPKDLIDLARESLSQASGLLANLAGQPEPQ